MKYIKRYNQYRLNEELNPVTYMDASLDFNANMIYIMDEDNSIWERGVIKLNEELSEDVYNRTIEEFIELGFYDRAYDMFKYAFEKGHYDKAYYNHLDSFNKIEALEEFENKFKNLTKFEYKNSVYYLDENNEVIFGLDNDGIIYIPSYHMSTLMGYGVHQLSFMLIRLIVIINLRNVLNVDINNIYTTLKGRADYYKIRLAYEEQNKSIR